MPRGSPYAPLQGPSKTLPFTAVGTLIGSVAEEMQAIPFASEPLPDVVLKGVGQLPAVVKTEIEVLSANKRGFPPSHLQPLC